MRRFRQWGALVVGACVALLSPALVQAQPALAVATADPAQVREQLASLLGRMNTAVAAADQPAYLACISLTDSCFATEQKNWVKDLARKPIEKFEIALAEGDVTLDESGAAKARLKWSWLMPKGRDRSLSFVARFVRNDSSWLYAGEKWNVLEGDHCRVSYADGLEDAAKTVTELLPDIRKHVHEGFELEGDKEITGRTQQVKLYSSMRHLQHSIYLSYTDSLGGWNEPAESVKILARSGSGKSSLRILLAHEYGHVATFQLGDTANDIPWWILEGIAELSASEYARDSKRVDRTVRGWAASGKLIEWEKLSDFHGEAVQHMGHVYTQGHHMVAYVSEKYGRQARNKWMRVMAQGAKLDDATQKVLGLSFADLDKQWRDSLKHEDKPEDKPDAKPETKPDAEKPPQ